MTLSFQQACFFDFLIGPMIGMQNVVLLLGFLIFLCWLFDFFCVFSVFERKECKKRKQAKGYNCGPYCLLLADANCSSSVAWSLRLLLPLVQMLLVQVLAVLRVLAVLLMLTVDPSLC